MTANPPGTLRVIIVDDEPLARERLHDLLALESDIDIIGECADGRQAISAIRELAPDLVFLDVQMPELDGFGVLEELGPETTPVVVFVTAYDQYALRAFEVHALDYLLKPFDRDRFRKAIARARQLISGDDTDAFRSRVIQLLSEIHVTPRTDTPQHLARMMVRTGGRVYFVRAADVDWIEAAGNYVRLHTGAESHVIRDSLSALETKLDPASFARIHRSTMVNLERVKQLEPLFHGDYTVVLHDGTRLTLSRFYRDAVETKLGGRL
jgi:two-component system LytT family response regulator